MHCNFLTWKKLTILLDLNGMGIGHAWLTSGNISPTSQIFNKSKEWQKVKIHVPILNTLGHSWKTPPPLHHSIYGQIEFLVSKDEQCSETLAKIIFQFNLIFSYNKIFISSL